MMFKKQAECGFMGVDIDLINEDLTKSEMAKKIN